MKLRNKKTGGAVYVDFRIPLSNNDETLGSYSVTSLEELNRSFEDYKPAEPLIKDKKIRKAVRAWAEANDITEINVASNGYELWGGDDDWCIHFSGDGFVNPFEHIKPQQYTIDELCGEEEE